MKFEEIINSIPQKPYYQDDAVAIYCVDCRDILPYIPDKSIDLVLTDPPYPDQHPEYGDIDLRLILERFTCRQLIFWSSKSEFPLAHITSIHIWHKKTPNEIIAYERIFERYGQPRDKVYAYYFINSTVAANYGNDIYTGHPSQKPQKLISQLVIENSKTSGLILDPFLGSGTTAYCAKKLGRKCIGIEIEEKYCEIAAKRLSQSVMRLE